MAHHCRHFEITRPRQYFMDGLLGPGFSPALKIFGTAMSVLATTFDLARRERRISPDTIRSHDSVAEPDVNRWSWSTRRQVQFIATCPIFRYSSVRTTTQQGECFSMLGRVTRLIAPC